MKKPLLAALLCLLMAAFVLPIAASAEMILIVPAPPTGPEANERTVGQSQVTLVTQDSQGKTLTGLEETNLGDFCADAFRVVMGADIGYVPGGDLLAPLEAGEVTYGDLLAVLPQDQPVALLSLSGQTILDMLELTMADWPQPSAAFPHVSGLAFQVNAAIDSSVVRDEAGNFQAVEGEYRVYAVQVLNAQEGRFEPLDLEKEYTLALSCFPALEQGLGMTMLREAKVEKNTGISQAAVLEGYLTEDLGGQIGEEYAQTQPNILFTKGRADGMEGGLGMRLGFTALVILCGTGIVMLSQKLKKKKA